MDKYIKQSELEHRFWLQILGDHSRFIFNSLSPRETDLISRACHYINTFDQFLSAARAPRPAAAWQAFAQKVQPAVLSLRRYKLKILTLHLEKMVSINLSPTFFNHMLNELEEYLRNLQYLMQGQPIPIKPPVHHHLLWILDAQGHAGSIFCMLDASQTSKRDLARHYQTLWGKKYNEAAEFAGFLRTSLTMFPALGDFDSLVASEMIDFKSYLEKLKCEALDAQALGTFNALIPDHMAREECYYLYQLQQSDPTNVPAPKCDPTRPRVTG